MTDRKHVDIIGKQCFIVHHDGRESFAGTAIKIVERGRTLVQFDARKLLWPIEQVNPIAEETT